MLSVVGGFFFITKERQINIRISAEDFDLIKKMGMNHSEIWKIGFDKWLEEYPEILLKKSQEYHELYIQCIDKSKKCIDNVYTKNSQKWQTCDEIYKRLNQQDDFNIFDRTNEMEGRIRAILKKNKINITVHDFIKHYQEMK